jgi:L-ascorbate metabolism protein UlaG (beta-lactamase superfamily)
MKLTWFSHSAFRIEVGHSIIVIDPFLTGNPRFSGDAVAASAGATHVILTHGHDDHVGDAVEILKRTKAQLISNYEICMFLNAQGVANINPGNTGGMVACGEFTVTFTQALHSSGTTKDGASIYLGNPNGIIIKHPEAPVIYHMGDTDVFGDMALINELHRPRLGLVPIGDRFTMGAATAAFAVKRYFHFDWVVPIHYATFDLLAPNADEFVTIMAGHPTKVLVPTAGEAVSF